MKNRNLILLGYAAAFGLALAAVAVRMALTDSPAAQASSGMLAFGDALLFLAVFGTLGLVPTFGAFLLLRRRPRFGAWLSAGGLLLAGTGLGALLLCLLATRGHRAPSLELLFFFAILRSLASPLAAAALGLATVIAPDHASRRRLLLAAAIEAPGLVYALAHWYRAMLPW